MAIFTAIRRVAWTSAVTLAKRHLQGSSFLGTIAVTVIPMSSKVKPS